MSTPDKTTPQIQQTPSGSSLPSDSWIMKALSDIREDMKDQNGKIDQSLADLNASMKASEARIADIESKITKLIWVVGTVGAVAAFIWGGYEVITGFVDINISVTPKKQ